MSLYQVGLGNEVHVIGATAPQKQSDGPKLLIIFGLLGVVALIPGKKGWQRALGSGK